MPIESVVAALSRLHTRGGLLSATLSSRDALLSRMRGYVGALGLSHTIDDMPRCSGEPYFPAVLHIAGTKGKGSVAAMAERILRDAGLRTGLFTSPHLIDVRERFRVNGQRVAADIFEDEFWAVWHTLQRHASEHLAEGMPPFFHFLTLLGFRLFARERVSALILETGVGGRTDATNILAARHVLACAMTTLDYDHMDVLGETLREIAWHKAGIMKPRVCVCVCAASHTHTPEVDAVIRAEAAAVNAPLIIAPTPDAIAARSPSGAFPPLGLSGDFQRVNACVAVAATDAFMREWTARRRAEDSKASEATADPPVVTPTSGGPLPPYVLSGLARCQWHGRAQTEVVDASTGRIAADAACADGVRLYLDGAHTQASVTEAAKWFAQQTALADGPRALVFYCGMDKDVVQLLLPLSTRSFQHVYFTQPKWTRPPLNDMPTAADAMRAFVSRYKATHQHDDLLADVSAESWNDLPRCKTWPETLQQLWTIVNSDRRLTALRARIAATLPNPTTVPNSVGPSSIHSSPEDVVSCISNVAKAGGPRSVLVTGSLHLVGGTLEAIGWTEQ